jgi:2,4-dienoyl-CoA reductase-like NADH-dependent reductase (Old Yellow Enzyme family)
VQQPKAYRNECFVSLEGWPNEGRIVLFKKIFEPIKLRGMGLKNRLIASPVTTNFASEKGDVTEKLLNYYRRRAEGGASLVIVEGSFVHPDGKAYVRQLGIYSDHIIPSLQKLVKIIHESGAKASIQIQHAGDCVEVRTALEAVYEGFRTGLEA